MDEHKNRRETPTAPSLGATPAPSSTEAGGAQDGRAPEAGQADARAAGANGLGGDPDEPTTAAAAAPAATGASELPAGMLFLNEYEYSNDLLTEFARLQVTDGVRRGLLVGGIALIALGAAALISDNPFGWIGLFAVLIGAFLIWYRGQMFHVLAKHYIDAAERGEGALSGRWRRVAVNDGGIMVFSADGRSRYYPFDQLKRLRRSDLMLVAEFGDEGVAVPAGTFVHGDADAFAQFLYEKRYGKNA